LLLYRTISAFLNYVEAAGWIDTPLLPRKGMATLAPPPKRRQRALTDDELIRVWPATDRLTPRQRALVRLLILTGTRLNQVAKLDAAEIDPRRLARRYLIADPAVFPLLVGEQWRRIGRTMPR
jgi:integrase